MDITQNIFFLILRKKENIRVWNGTRVSKWLWWQSLISNGVLTISSRDQERQILYWNVHDRLFSACMAWFKSLAETIKANSRKQREKWGTKNLLKYMDGTLIHRLHEHLNQLRNLTNPSLAPFESCFSCLETVNLQAPCRAAVQMQKP